MLKNDTLIKKYYWQSGINRRSTETNTAVFTKKD